MGDVLSDAMKDLVARSARETATGIQLARVVSVRPLKLELLEQRGTLEDDEIELTQGASRYDDEIGIDPDDTVVLLRKRTGGVIHWVVSDVLSNNAATPAFNPDDSDLHYTHHQTVPAATWIISHGLGKKPHIDAFDTAGTEQTGEVSHISNDLATISFTAGGNPAVFAGVAECN